MVIPADTFPDQNHIYTTRLTLTNDDATHGGFGDTSDEVQSMPVDDGSVQVDFNWLPNSPEIGQLVSFSIIGVGEIDSATWNFGGPGCTGYTQNVTCVADNDPYFG